MDSRLLVLVGTVVGLAVPTPATAHGRPPIHGTVDGIPAVVPVPTASADLSGYQTEATFTVITPYVQVGQWNDVWTHNYTVTVNPQDGSFAGIGIQYDDNMEQTATETITGTFGPGSVTFAVVRGDDGVSWTLANATYGGAVTLADVKPGWPIEMKVTNPAFTTPRVWPHGDYVSRAGGDDTAQSCTGKPIHINRNASHHRVEKTRTFGPSLCRREQRQ